MTEIAHTILLADGQIGLSAKFLKYLGLKIGEDVIIKTENRQVVVVPARLVADELWGTIKLDSARIQELFDIEEWG